MCRDNRRTLMSEIESQTNDLLQLQGQLEKIFDVLEGGSDLSKEQIDLLRYGCGFAPVNRMSNSGQMLWNMLVDTNNLLARNLK